MKTLTIRDLAPAISLAVLAGYDTSGQAIILMILKLKGSIRKIWARE
jgi:hypothetical protein